MITELILTKLAEHLIAQSIDAVQGRVDRFVKSLAEVEGGLGQGLPSASIVGIGRCGTNIALDVADSIYKSRKVNIREEAEQEDLGRAPDRQDNLINHLMPWLSRKVEDSGQFLVDPVILAADLDGDTPARIEELQPQLFDDGILRFQLSQLEWLNTGGAGNIPIVGQYMALLAIVAQQDAGDGYDRWIQHKSYLIDSAGLEVNRTRLYFYLFSCGGGSGSGMASIFGTAQQNAYFKNLTKHRCADDSKFSEMNESICSIGIGVLPSLPRPGTAASAQHLNSGRVICSYLSQHNKFNLNFNALPREKEDVSPMRMFNTLLFVSNDIMRHAFPVGERDLAAVQAETKTNKYVAQQIFNLLTAQATIADYDMTDREYKEMFGGDLALGDTTRLDAGDLGNCLDGPAAVGYSERASENEGLDSVFIRALSPPTENKDGFIEGISILPRGFEAYSAMCEGSRESLVDLPFYRCAYSVVVIISAPEGDDLGFDGFSTVREMVDTFFPSAAIKRYAFVVGITKKLSLTLFIAGSACSTSDVHYNMVNYICRCFAENEKAGEVAGIIRDVLKEEKFDSSKLEEALFDVESIEPILVGNGGGNWSLKKLECEQKFARFSIDSEGQRPAVELDELLVTKQDVINALQYIHRLEKGSVLPVIEPDSY